MRPEYELLLICPAAEAPAWRRLPNCRVCHDYATAQTLAVTGPDVLLLTESGLLGRTAITDLVTRAKKANPCCLTILPLPEAQGADKAFRSFNGLLRLLDRLTTLVKAKRQPAIEELNAALTNSLADPNQLSRATAEEGLAAIDRLRRVLSEAEQRRYKLDHLVAHITAISLGPRELRNGTNERWLRAEYRRLGGSEAELINAARKSQGEDAISEHSGVWLSPPQGRLAV